MKAQAGVAEIARVCQRIESLGFKPHIIPGEQRTAIGITGNSGPVDPAEFEDLPGVAEAIRVSKAYKLVSRETKRENTVVRVHGVPVGGPELVLCGGPCSVETRQQILESARAVKAAGGQLLRGGAYKPRTSPIASRVWARKDCSTWPKLAKKPVSALSPKPSTPKPSSSSKHYADCVQIGARNMQNFSLLRRAGKSRKPVLLKRGMSSTLEEFLMAAEYILAEGNYNVILCERGVRTFADHTRNTLDLSVVPAVQPSVICPSSSTPAMEPASATRCCPWV